MRRRTAAAVVATLVVAVTALAGCASTEPEVGAPIVLGGSPTAGVVPDGDPTGAPAPSPSTQRPVDDDADLDVDDQAGDGRTVRVESARTSLPAARIVIADATGRILGSDRITPGVQVVTIALDVPVTASGELVAMLVVDNGDGIVDLAGVVPIVDDEGEPVEEDFDYALR